MFEDQNAGMVEEFVRILKISIYISDYDSIFRKSSISDPFIEVWEYINVAWGQIWRV